MKRVLTLALAVTMIAGVAAADHIGIYTDQVGANQNCTIVPPAFNPWSVFVVHKFTTGATGSEWMVTDATGQTQSGSAVLGGYLAIGGPYAGISLAYGGCLNGPDIAIVQLNFFGFPVPAAACGKLEVVPSPNAGGIIKAVDCNFAENPATGGKFYVNSNSTCLDCGEPQPNPTEESTWGKVKSLYR